MSDPNDPFFNFADLFWNHTHDSEVRSTPADAEPSLSPEEKARRETYQKNLIALFQIGVDASKRPVSPLRAIVETLQWFVPAQSNGEPELVYTKAGAFYSAAMEPWKEGQKRLRGQGGHLLPLYLTDPGRPAKVVEGRILPRLLPKNLDGLLLHLQHGEPPVELAREAFPELRALADALDYEDCLITPAPGQAKALLSATLYVPMEGRKLETWPAFEHGSAASAYTHPAYAVHGVNEGKLVPVIARDLFELFLKDERIDALEFLLRDRTNPGLLTKRYFAPGEAHALLTDNDIRPGTKRGRMRSRRELEIWEDIGRNSKLDIGKPEYVETQEETETLVHIRWPLLPHASKEERDASPARVSPTFELDTTEPPPGELGKGQSEILCPGYLAGRLLWATGSWDEKSPKTWAPQGKKLLFLRHVNAEDLATALTRATLARELLKFIPTGSDRIPRQAIRSVEGASLFRRKPFLRTREWIEQCLAHALGGTKAWNWK